MQTTGIAHRKIDEAFMVYDGKNHEAVMNFLESCKRHP